MTLIISTSINFQHFTNNGTQQKNRILEENPSDNGGSFTFGLLFLVRFSIPGNVLQPATSHKPSLNPCLGSRMLALGR
jgi:hypothetical protein